MQLVWRRKRMERRYKEARMKEGSEGKDECCYRNGDVYTEGEANRIRDHRDQGRRAHRLGAGLG